MNKSIDRLIDFFLYEKGSDIKVNGITRRAFILDATDRINSYDDKIIHSKVEIKTGDIIEHKDRKYLITSQVNENSNSYTGRMRLCDYAIIINFSGNTKRFDVVVETKVLDIDSGKVVSLGTGKIQVTLRDYPDSRDIVLEQRFLHTGRAWKVTGIDKSRRGLLVLTCDIDVFNAYDDRVNEIVDRWKYEVQHNYVISIGTGDTVQVPLNETYQLSVVVKDNGTPMSPLPALTFLSSDPSIVTVDNLGNLMGISNGEATITCRMTYRPEITASINASVIEEVDHLYTISISGSSTIKLNQSLSYVAQFYDNGVEVFDQSATWSIRNQDGTSTLYATITSSTGNSVTIKADSKSGNVNKYVVLAATLDSDASVFTEFAIQIKSLF